MRYKITIEYDGTNYSGWQKQEGKFSIQESLQKAIYFITKEETEVFGSGRTDAGVHAKGMVAHFDLIKEVDPFRLMCGANYYLKAMYLARVDCIIVTKNSNIQDISIIDCVTINEDFHARFSAKKRFYEYRILNRKSPSALNANRVWCIHKELDIHKMQEVLPFLIGSRDWSSFRDSDCQAKSPIKTIDKVNLTKINDEIVFEIEARSFLHHMVRNIVGTLVEVGLGKISTERFIEIIEARDRTKAGPTAPSQGLYFVRAIY